MICNYIWLFVGVNVHGLFCLNQLIPELLQPAPCTLDRDLSLTKVKANSGDDGIINFMLEAKWCNLGTFECQLAPVVFMS